jgi:hypothetical protein
LFMVVLFLLLGEAVTAPLPAHYLGTLTDRCPISWPLR